MAIPSPGKKVRGSYSGSPINAIFDLLGRRWALGIVWNMEEGPFTFRELQEKCGGISPSILNSRIKDLKEADIIERSLEGYRLTDRGQELRKALMPLGKWSLTWADEIFNYQKKAANCKE
ncbi:MAG: helix-turn-helix transcriptional regulator [bacterium]|nr:helix-turn-helix transcriptional regulator [bacterium]